jgi:hypothetical protein
LDLSDSSIEPEYVRNYPFEDLSSPKIERPKSGYFEPDIAFLIEGMIKLTPVEMNKFG